MRAAVTQMFQEHLGALVLSGGSVMAGKLAECATAVIDFTCLAVQSAGPASQPLPPTIPQPVVMQSPMVNPATAGGEAAAKGKSQGQDQASKSTGVFDGSEKGPKDTKVDTGLKHPSKPTDASGGSEKGPKNAKVGAGVDSSKLPLQFERRKFTDPPQETITRPLVIIGDSQVGRMETHFSYNRCFGNLLSFHSLPGVSAVQAADYLQGITLDLESVNAVVLFFGTVDFANHNWSTVTQSITELVRILRVDKNFQGEILVVDIPPLEEVGEQVAQVNSELTSSAAAGQYEVIPFNESLIAEAAKIGKPLQKSGLMNGIHITALAGRLLLRILHDKGHKTLKSKGHNNRDKAKKLAKSNTTASGAIDSSVPPDDSQSNTGVSGTGNGVPPGGSQQAPGEEEKMETESKEEEPQLEEQFQDFEKQYQEQKKSQAERKKSGSSTDSV